MTEIAIPSFFEFRFPASRSSLVEQFLSQGDPTGGQGSQLRQIVKLIRSAIHS